MSIFYTTLERFKDFSSKINIKIQQFLPEYSLFGNIIASYDNALDDKQKTENKNYIVIKNKLGLLSKDIETRQDIIKNLAPMLLDFENCYNRKYNELEFNVISQKSFIRAKEDELNNYISLYKLKMEEKKQLEEKTSLLKSDIEKLKGDIEERCQKYIETVSINNINGLKSSIADISSSFSKDNREDINVKSEYMSSFEYLNSTMEYKGAYKRLYAFMSGLSSALQDFIDKSNIEKILPDLAVIQNQIKEKYNNIDKLEAQTDKIKDFENLKDNYYKALRNEEDKLKDIIGLADRDEELLKIRAEIEEYINKTQVI